MAYLLSKIAAGLFGVWGVFVVTGANVSFYDETPSPATTTAQTVYRPVEQAPEALETTTTQVTTIANCNDVVNLAQALGWPVDQLTTLRYIAQAESACMPWAHNVTDPNGGSYGLMQINGFWCIPNTYWPTGWLQAQGILVICDDLFNATINLQAARAIQSQNGWHPWTTFTGN